MTGEEFSLINSYNHFSICAFSRTSFTPYWISSELADAHALRTIKIISYGFIVFIGRIYSLIFLRIRFLVTAPPTRLLIANPVRDSIDSPSVKTSNINLLETLDPFFETRSKSDFFLSLDFKGRPISRLLKPLGHDGLLSGVVI